MATSTGSGYRVARDDDGHVVLAAVGKCGLDERLASRRCLALCLQNLRDRFVVHDIVKAVTAEKNLIAVEQAYAMDLGLAFRLLASESVREDVSQAMGRDRLGLNDAGIREHLCVGMVARKPAQDAIATEIGTGVADVNDEEIVPDAISASHRGPHAAKLRFQPSFLYELGIHFTIVATGAFHDFLRVLFVEPQDPIRHMQDDIDEGLYREPARDLASRVAPHSVSDDGHA